MVEVAQHGDDGVGGFLGLVEGDAAETRGLSHTACMANNGM